MACGCQDNNCSCVINGANGNVVSGSGTVDDPYVVTAPDPVFSSDAATTLGTVVGKIEAFDSLGNSLGFLPVYDAIT